MLPLFSELLPTLAANRLQNATFANGARGDTFCMARPGLGRAMMMKVSS